MCFLLFLDFVVFSIVFGFCGILYCFWILWDFVLCKLTGRLRCAVCPP